MRACSMLLAGLLVVGCFDAQITPRVMGPTGDGDGDGGVTEVRHGACSTGVTAPLPPEPDVDRDEHGIPTFDRWTAFACEDLDAVSKVCGYMLSCPFEGSCMYQPHGNGLCVGREGLGDVPVSFAKTRCIAEVTPREKAALCCDYPRELDCRPWPFEGSSAPGELCAVHADCAPGLLCKLGEFHVGGEEMSPVHKNFGRCVCPELEPSQVIIDSDCLEPSAPAPWLGELDEPYETCEGTGEYDWVSEPAGFGALGPLRAALGPELGYLTFVSTSGVVLGSKAFGRPEDHIDAEAMTFAAIYGADTGVETAILVDPRGLPHVVISRPLALLRAPRYEPEPIADDAELVALALDDLERDVVAFVRKGAVWVAQKTEAGFDVEKVSDGVKPYGLFVHTSDAAIDLVFGKTDGIYRARSSERGYEVVKLASGSSFDAAIDEQGVLHLVYEGLPTAEGEPAADATLASFDAYGLDDQSTLYRHMNDRYRRENTRPQLALAPDGTLWVSHREPTGLSVHARSETSRETTTLLVPSLHNELVVDRYGVPHLFVATRHGDEPVQLHVANLSRCTYGILP